MKAKNSTPKKAPARPVKQALKTAGHVKSSLKSASKFNK